MHFTLRVQKCTFIWQTFYSGIGHCGKKDQTKRKEDLLSNLVFLSREYVVCLQIAIQWNGRVGGKKLRKLWKEKCIYCHTYIEPRWTLNMKHYSNYCHFLALSNLKGLPFRIVNRFELSTLFGANILLFEPMNSSCIYSSNAMHQFLSIEEGR